VCTGEGDAIAQSAATVSVAGLSKPARATAVAQPKGGAADIDPQLHDYLREWRRVTAKEQGVPAFVVMHDTSLEALCRARPVSLSALLAVSGFGERKVEMYGEQILDAIGRFGKGERAATRIAWKLSKPAEETRRLLAEGRSFQEIAALRGREVSTIIGTVADLVERGEFLFQPHWVSQEACARIEEACGRLGFGRLRVLKDALPPEITFDEIRLVAAQLRRRNHSQSSSSIS
jgi:ATP-dependent DNA helicase RecQ